MEGAPEEMGGAANDRDKHAALTSRPPRRRGLHQPTR
jgi:hypothetical protein